MIGKLQKAIAQQDEAKVEDKEVQNLSKKFHILTENLAKVCIILWVNYCGTNNHMETCSQVLFCCRRRKTYH